MKSEKMEEIYAAIMRDREARGFAEKVRAKASLYWLLIRNPRAK